MLRKNVISITNKREGSILVLAVMTLLILSSVLAATFLITSNKFATMFQTASWQEALFGAESGADLAMTALNTKVWTGNGTWAGWKTGTGTPPKVLLQLMQRMLRQPQHPLPDFIIIPFILSIIVAKEIRE